MKVKNYFKEGKNNIVYVGDNFKVQFYSMDFKPSKIKLSFKKLEKPMNDKEILEESKPEKSTLGDILYALKTNKDLLKNGYANIFYVRDNKKILWAVGVFWSAGGWRVSASSVESPSSWFGGRRVFSRNFGNSKSLALPDLLEINGVKYRKI